MLGSFFSLRLSKRVFLMLFLPLLLLSGCGQSLSPQNIQKTPTPVSKPPQLGTTVKFDIGGWLHIQSVPGFTCSYSSQGAAYTPGTVVLPTVRPTYDQGTLQSLANYLTTIDQDNYGSTFATVQFPPLSANPDAFQLVPVNTARAGCDEILQVTNIGNAPVQITQVSVQFKADTQVNNRHYNLVDRCPFDSSECFFVGGAEASYYAEFDLGSSGKEDSIIPATCWGWGYAPSGCSPQLLSLKPGEVAQVWLHYSSSTSDKLSFSLMPIFTLNELGTGKQTVYPTPQLQATFSFASTSQFSCYTLHGQQFTEVSLYDPKYFCM